MLEWPAAVLGNTLVKDGFQYETPDGRLRNPMDRGPSKSRGDSEGAPNAISCTSIDWNSGQLSRWRRFWSEESQGGNLPFTIRDPQLDGEPLWDEDGVPVLDEDGEPVLISSSWLVIFGESKPVERPLGGGWWRVSFDLERLDG